MDTNFHINPQGNSNKFLNKTDKNATSYMPVKNNGLQKDTVSFSGKHIHHGGSHSGAGNWKRALFSLLGLASVATPMATILTGCNSRDAQAIDNSGEVSPMPSQPETGAIVVPDSYLAVLPEIVEDYSSVQHLYLDKDATFREVTFAPTNLPKGVIQTIVSPEKDDEDNALVGSTLRALIDKATPVEAIAEANGIEDIGGAWHNAIHEYLQANPDLAVHIATLNDVEDVEELTDDVIADTVLYKEGDKPLTLLGVIAPTFKMPVPGFGNEDKVDTVLVQTQYSPKYTNDGYVIVDADDTLNPTNKYKNVGSVIINEYGVSDGYNDPAFMVIAHQIANHPNNREIIETYIQDLNIATAVDDVTSPEDNKRTQALLAMEHIDGLYLPDNILVNSIQHNTGDKEYKYTAGKTVYQLSARSPINGENVHSIILESEIDPDADPTPNGIQKLEDVLKFYFDPRTGAPLAEIVKDSKGKATVQSNIKDQLGADLAVNYMVNVIKDNLGIFAATQEIGDKLNIFGAYDIKDEEVVKFINEQIHSAMSDSNVTNDMEAALIARDAAVEKFADGSIEDFLEQFTVLNLDKAKMIELYDEDGEIRFKNADGSPVEFKLSDAYVTFGKATEVKASTPNNSGTPGKSDTPTSSTPGPTSSTPGPSSSTPGPSSSTPGPSSSTPGPSSSTPGPSSSTPGPSSSTPGPSSSTPGPSSSTPGPSSSTPGPSSSTPGPSSSTPGPSSSTPGPSSSTPGPSSSTPGPSSSTPGPSSSTPGPSSSTPGPSSSTPGGSYTPPFNSDTPVIEPSDTPSSTPSSIPSETPSGTPSESPIPSDCLPPPPPSNSATATKPNTVTGGNGPNAVTPPATTPSAPGGSSTQSSTASTGGTPGIGSIGEATSTTPAPTQSSTPTPSNTENKVTDSTSGAIMGATDTEERGGGTEVAESEPQAPQASEPQASAPAVAPAPASAPQAIETKTAEISVNEEAAAPQAESSDKTAEAIQQKADVEIRSTEQEASPASAEVSEDGEEIIIEE